MHATTRLRIFWIAIAASILLLSLSSLVVSSAAPFGANVRVSDDSSVANERKPAVVADPSGNVYAAWGQNHNGDTDLYFAKSSDGGITWSASRRIGGTTPSGSTQDRPSLALGPNGELVVAWQDDRLTYFDFDIYAMLSLDGGATFGTPVRVSDGPPGSLQLAPEVAVGNGGRVLVAWQDFRAGHGDIRASTATLTAFVFGESVHADDDLSGGTAAAPSAVVSSTGMLYIAYHDNRSGNADVYLAKSSDGGLTYAPSVRIDSTGSSGTAQGLVSIAVDGLGRIYAIWQDARAGEVEADGRPIFDIYFALSTDGGRTFSANVRVDDGPRKTTQEAPRIAVGAAGTIYVVWDDGRNTDWDPYFTYSTDGGTTFAPNIRVDDAGDSTTDPPLQYDPQIVESRTGLAFVAWEDDRGPTADIYGATGYIPVGSALCVRADLVPDTAWPGDPVQLTVRVTSNGTVVDGVTLSFASSASGSFGTVQRISAGVYQITFSSSPSTPDGTDVVLTATAQKAGYVSGASQALLHVRKSIVASVYPMWDLLAVGQTMLVSSSATAHGGPLPGASMLSGTGAGGTMSPASGTTDSQGSWTAWFTPSEAAGGTDVTISVNATKDGYDAGSARAMVPILAQPRLLGVAISSKTREMMSRERADIRVDLTSGGVAVTKAILAPFCVRGGNFSAVNEVAPGVYKYSWVAPDVSTPTWASLGVRIQRGGYSDASAKLAVLVDPNMTNPTNPTQLFVIAVPDSQSVQSGHSVGFAVYVYTMQGYMVAGASIVVSLVSGTGTATRVTDELNGLYTFVYTAPVVTSSTGVLVRIYASKAGYAMGSSRVALLVLP